jgi:predicted phosphodiesterase
MRRRDLLAGLAGLPLASAGPGRPASPKKDQEPPGPRYRVAVVSDLHWRQEASILGAIRRQATELKALDADLILFNGDAWNGSMAMKAAEAAPAYRTLRDWAEALEVRTEWVIGNHDLFDFRSDPQGSKKRAEDGLLRAEAVRQIPLCPGWKLVAADSITPEKEHEWGFASRLGEAQISRLEGLIQGTDQVILAVHSPILSAYHSYESGAYAPVRHRMICDDPPELLARLRRPEIRCVVQGHTHIRETVDYGGIPHVTAGAACGNWWSGRRFGLHGPAALIIDIHGQGLKTAYKELPEPSSND